MIFWITLGAIALVILSAYLADRYDNGLPSYSYYTQNSASNFWGGVAIVSLVVAVLGGVFLIFAGLVGVQEDDECETYDLVALNTGSTIHGEASFFLGTGYSTTDEYQTITFVKRNSDGSVQLDERRASRSRIFEDATASTSYMTCLQETRVDERSWFFPWWEDVEYNNTVGYAFHIPPNSVSHDFEVSP